MGTDVVTASHRFAGTSSSPRKTGSRCPGLGRRWRTAAHLDEERTEVGIVNVESPFARELELSLDLLPWNACAFSCATPMKTIPRTPCCCHLAQHLQAMGSVCPTALAWRSPIRLRSPAAQCTHSGTAGPGIPLQCDDARRNPVWWKTLLVHPLPYYRRLHRVLKLAR